jgi:hypothetical protein
MGDVGKWPSVNHVLLRIGRTEIRNYQSAFRGAAPYQILSVYVKQF